MDSFGRLMTRILAPDHTMIVGSVWSKPKSCESHSRTPAGSFAITTEMEPPIAGWFVNVYEGQFYSNGWYYYGTPISGNLHLSKNLSTCWLKHPFFAQWLLVISPYTALEISPWLQDLYEKYVPHLILRLCGRFDMPGRYNVCVCVSEMGYPLVN